MPSILTTMAISGSQNLFSLAHMWCQRPKLGWPVDNSTFEWYGIPLLLARNTDSGLGRCADILRILIHSTASSYAPSWLPEANHIGVLFKYCSSISCHIQQSQFTITGQLCLIIISWARQIQQLTQTNQAQLVLWNSIITLRSAKLINWAFWSCQDIADASFCNRSAGSRCISKSVPNKSGWWIALLCV